MLAVSPKLFGRRAQLAALQAQLEAASEGVRGIVLVSGEAGVGKSRLLSEALQTPQAAPYVQIRATCIEGDEAEPYALARALITAAGSGAANVSFDPAPEAERQVRQGQQALWTVLQEVRDERPLLLIVEDVHWSDAPSLQVLLGLASQADAPLLWLSHRPQPMPPGLAAFLADANRLRLATTIPLQPLSTAHTARMVRAMLGLQRTLPPGLLHEVMTVGEGIPFFIEELLHTFLKQGRLQRAGDGWRFARATAPSVPDSLRHAVEGRLLPLPRQVIAVAEQAAVLGQRVNVSRLARLSQMDEADLFAALRALLEAQILSQKDDGAIAFRHALTREAIRKRLLRAERQSLHRRVALMLEAEGGAAPSALAYHWRGAGDRQRAAGHAYRAAQQAAALHAHRQAIAHYELALSAASGAAADREAILRAIGDQFHALGEHEQAVAHYRQAQAGYREAGDAIAAADLDLCIGEAYGRQRFRKEALQSLQAAFTRLPVGHPRRWRAGLHLGLQQAASGNHEQAQATFLAAQADLQQAADGPRRSDHNTLARLRVAYELSGLQARRGDWMALQQAARRVLREAPDAGDEALALRHDAHAALGSVAYYRGALQETLVQFTVCLRMAQQRGLPGDEALARWNLATNALYHLGRWQEAREHLATVQTLGVEGLAEAALTFEQWLDGAWETALERWRRDWPDMQESGDLEVLMAFGRRIADTLLALERFQEALQLLQPLIERQRQHQATSYEIQLLPRFVEAQAKAGDAGALPLAQTGLQLARTLGGRPAEGLLLRGRAMARQQAEEWLKVFADYEAAIALLEELSMPYEAARTQREAGLARLARGRRGDRRRGADLLKRARQQFADLGAGRDEQATAAILSSAGLTGEGQPGPGPLTAREREVAQLVTQGLSNGEIAERLFITEKTAAYHVGNILNKLGFNSRVEIAVYMTQQE